VSTSMLARDFNPDRISAAKDIAIEFISQRPSDRIGIVVFAGESYTQCPLTTDRATLINLMKEIETGLIDDGTAIGNGLATAVARMQDSDAKSRVVVLLTDGVNNSGEITPQNAADIAKTYGVRTYTIEIYSEINKMEKARTTIDSFPVYKELYAKFGFVALLCLMAEVLLSLFVLRRLP